MTEYLDLRPRAELPIIRNVEQLNPNLSPIEYLLARMRDPTTPEQARTRIAIALLPFTTPKLAVSANVSEKDFATLLDRRTKYIEKWKATNGDQTIEGSSIKKEIDRVNQAKMIEGEAKPVEQSTAEEFADL